eukprot:gene8075-8939_t
MANKHENNIDNYQLNINRKYAKKYEKTKEKQELDRLKQKYGDDQMSTESSSSESEDEDAEALTPQIEKDFLKTLTLIKQKDPKIYDKEAKFYNSQDESSHDESKVKTENKKPVYLKDYERERLLKKGVKALISDSESEDEDEQIPKSMMNNLTYIEEQKQLKESFKNAIESNDDDDDDDDNESFLQLREKSTNEKEREEVDYKNWLDSSKLKENEIDDEKFLANYILNKGYQDTEKDRIPSYSNIVEESESDVDEEEQFERKFNFRFEEPDEDFIKRYPRTVKETTRRVDDKRKKKRQLREERKLKEKETKKEEIRKMKNLKRKEIMAKIEKLKEITGNSKVGFLEDDLDGDFDPSKYDDIMKNVYDDDFYKDDGNEIEKPVFSDLEDNQEGWDEWEENSEAYHAQADEEIHCEDPEFNMDADYQPSAKKPKRSSSLKDIRKSSKLAKALNGKKPAFDPDEKSFEEYFDEFYKLDYEDIIGDMPVRFKYRQVLPNNFGLSTDEILMAEDKELNQWCSLKKPISYNTKEEEWKERLRYKKKARNKEKKARVFPSIYSDERSEGAEVEKAGDLNKKIKTNDGDKSMAKKESTHHPSTSGHNKHRLFTSKWKRDVSLQSEAVPKRKGQLFKHSKFEAMSKISSSRLAAYGIDAKRRKRKRIEKS